jgi:hypothetical protein
MHAGLPWNGKPGSIHLIALAALYGIVCYGGTRTVKTLCCPTSDRAATGPAEPTGQLARRYPKGYGQQACAISLVGLVSL